MKTRKSVKKNTALFFLLPFAVPFILMGILMQCAEKKTFVNRESDFTRYINSLETLEDPLQFNSGDGIKVRSENYDTTTFQLFKHTWSSHPHGKLVTNDSIIKTVELIIGDMVVPVIMTYDRNGNKIDSLMPFKKSGGDIGYESSEYMTIHQNQITVIDSTSTAEVNAEQDDIIEGTWIENVDTVVYVIQNNGVISNTKN